MKCIIITIIDNVYIRSKLGLIKIYVGSINRETQSRVAFAALFFCTKFEVSFMSIVVKDLLKLELFQNIIKLVSDGSGMESPVNWPYIKQTAEIRPWLNGGEIVFVTGNSNDKTDKEQIALLMEGIECKVAAFVFLCGDEYINKLSDKVIDFANSVKIPVFTMPYDVKLIDVVKEIANAIMESGSRERMIMNFMTDLLHGNFKNDDHIRKQGYECGINIDQNCMAMSIETNFDYEGESYSQIMSVQWIIC